MSFLRPPEGFPPHLVCIWPLVWCQLLLLRVAVRAAYGQDARYWWSITPNGRVFLTSIHFGLKDKAAKEWLKPRAHSSDRLAAACDGRAAVPAFAQYCAQPSACREIAASYRPSHSMACVLPLPET